MTLVLDNLNLTAAELHLQKPYRPMCTSPVLAGLSHHYVLAQLHPSAALTHHHPCPCAAGLHGHMRDRQTGEDTDDRRKVI
jgi:hypothetical protein